MSPPRILSDPTVQCACPGACPPPHDHRAIARRDFIQRFGLVGLADDDQAVDLARADILVEPVLILRDDTGQQQIIAALGKFIGKVAEHGDEERV